MTRLDAIRLRAFLMLAVVCGCCLSAAAGDLSLVSVEPTVLLVRQGPGLGRAVDITIENKGEPANAVLDILIASKTESINLKALSKGKSSHRICLPDVQESTPVLFSLKVGDEVVGRVETALHRQRRWRVFVIPITHHDLGYTDTIENVLNRYAGFYDDVLRFCEETDDFPEEARYHYTFEGTWSVQNYIDSRPAEALEKMKKYVSAGRIEVGALFGNQISGIHSHEQLARLMYPSFRFQRMFGGEIRCGSITDVPGLSWGLPTVMAEAGVKYFFAGLPTYFEWGRNDIHTFWDESKILRNGRPDAFWWQGPDKQKVLVYYQGSYGFFKDVTGPHDYQYVEKNLPPMLAELEEQGCDFDVMRYIHNGVDNYPPSVVISEIARRWNATYAYPKLIVATNTMFFDELARQDVEFRTFSGELPHTDYAVGAISTARQTTINRRTHDELAVAEKSATIASLTTDFEYPADEITRAYDNMLLYDEHTWGKDYPAGPIQDMAWSEKSHYAYRAAGIADPIVRFSLDRIAHNLELVNEGWHIVAFNPLSINRTDVVRATKFGKPGSVAIVDIQTGREVPHQIVKLTGPQAPVPYAAYRYARGAFEEHELYDMVFVAENVPSMGYKTYRMVEKPEAQEVETALKLGRDYIENDFYRVKVSRKTGAVSVYDKQLGRWITDSKASHGANQLVVRSVVTGKSETVDDVKIVKNQAGPVYASLTVTAAAAGCPQVTQEIILYERLKRVDFSNRILKDSTPLQEVYFAFPFDVDEPEIRFEGSDSVIEPFVDQFPGSNTNYYSVQHWAHACEDGLGVTFAPVESHLVEFGGIWPCYVSQAHHGVDAPDFGQAFVTRDQVKKGYMYAFVTNSNFRTNFQPVQQADILFRYSITSQQGDWAASGCRDFGWSVSNPLRAVTLRGKRSGKLASSSSFCQIDKANVFLLALKRAEDGDGLIARLIETQGKATTARLRLPYLTIASAERTSIVEKGGQELDFGENYVDVPMRTFGISTVRIRP